MNIKECFLKLKNKNRLFLTMCLLFVASLFLSYAVWQLPNLLNNGDLVVTFSVSSTPYAYGTGEQCNHGFDYDIACLLAQRLRKNLVIKNISFEQAMQELKEGTIDLIGASVSITDERLQNMAMVRVYGCLTQNIAMIFWNSPFYQQKFSSFKDTNVSIHRVKSILKDVPIGTIAGKVWASLLKKYGFNTIKIYNDEQNLIAALRQGTISAAVLGGFVAKFLHKQNTQIQWLEVKLDEPWSHGAGIAINKNRTALINQVSEIIQELKEDKIIKLELQRWFSYIDK